MTHTDEPNPYAPSLYGETGQAVAKPKAPSLGDQIVGVFTDPVPLFQKLNLAPSWGWALGVIILTGLAMGLAWGLKVDVDAMLRPILEANPQLNGNQIDGIIEMQQKFMLPFTLGGILVATPFMLAFMALVTWGVASIFPEGERPTFLQALSAVCVPGLVIALKNTLTAVMCLLRPVGGSRIEQLSPTSVGFYVHVAQPKLQALLHNVDLMAIWAYVLTFLAVRYLLKAKPAAAWIMVSLGVVFTAVGVAFAK